MSKWPIVIGVLAVPLVEILSAAFFLVVQTAAADPTGSLTGWAGCGLLGMVLGWLLLRYLPGKDKQMETFVSNKDKQVQQIIARHDEKIAWMTRVFRKDSREARQSFREAMADVLKHCDNEMAKFMETVREELSKSENPDPPGPVKK